MSRNKPLALLITALVGLGAACSDASGTTSDTTAVAAAVDSSAATVDSSDSETAQAEAATTGQTADTTAAVTDSTAVAASANTPPRGGPGGGVSVDSVSSVDDLISLVQSAYGDAGLGLHRGHQPVESTLIDVLGISHDEMHVRMESQGQNLAAIATDLDVDPQTLIDALVATSSPAIDNLLAAGTITQADADGYLAALEEAFTYRVTWNGTDATPTFAGL